MSTTSSRREFLAAGAGLSAATYFGGVHGAFGAGQPGGHPIVEERLLGESFLGTFDPGLPPLLVEASNAGSVDNEVSRFGFWDRTDDHVDGGENAGRIALRGDRSKKTRAEFKTPKRPNTNNVTEAYTLSFFIPQDFTTGTLAPANTWTDCITMAQHRWCGSPLAGAPIVLILFNDHISVWLNSGATEDGHSQYNSNWDLNEEGDEDKVPGMLAIPHDLWAEDVIHRLIVRIHWSTGTDGAIRVLHQLKGDTNWTKTVEQTGFATLAYDPGQAPPPECHDKWGLYRWTKSIRPVAMTFDNLCRFDSVGEAQEFYAAL